LEEPCVWVESNNTTLNILTSHAEIGLGFLLIISLFSSVSAVFSFFSLIFLWHIFLLHYKVLFDSLHCISYPHMQVAAEHNTNIHVLAGLFSVTTLVQNKWENLLNIFRTILSSSTNAQSQIRTRTELEMMNTG